jgi:hypothetical protein
VEQRGCQPRIQMELRRKNARIPSHAKKERRKRIASKMKNFI